MANNRGLLISYLWVGDGVMKPTVFVIVLTSLVLVTSAYSGDGKDYVSPDGSYIATILRSERTGEDKVSVKSKDGETVCSKDYSSEDGQHGFAIKKAQWMPDSKFFVYSMSSSGGHQPWYFPIDFCSVSSREVMCLDEHTGPVASPWFTIQAPDVIKGMSMKKNIGHQEKFTVRLTNLEKSKADR